MLVQKLVMAVRPLPAGDAPNLEALHLAHPRLAVPAPGAHLHMWPGFGSTQCRNIEFLAILMLGCYQSSASDATMPWC